MKKIRFILIVMLVLACLPTVTWAGEEPGQRLAPLQLRLRPGQTATVKLQVKQALVTFAVESHLRFDPAVIEIVDVDETRAGVQIAPSRWLDPANGFTLQNSADNQAGAIDYAAVLLNPAPPVEDSGVLARITLRAKAPGETVLEIDKALFGQPTGEVVVSTVAHAQVIVRE